MPRVRRNLGNRYTIAVEELGVEGSGDKMSNKPARATFAAYSAVRAASRIMREGDMHTK